MTCNSGLQFDPKFVQDPLFKIRYNIAVKGGLSDIFTRTFITATMEETTRAQALLTLSDGNNEKKKK